MKPAASPQGMYLAHFGLRTAPFGITPDPAFFYPGNTRGELLAALLYAVTQGEGIIKLTGEVGSGKTMLCRMLAERLPAHVDVLYLLNPSLEPDEVMHAIGAELGLDTAGSRTDAVLRALHDELIARHAAGRQVVLLAEEAQAMPVPTLEALRLLTNLETASHKLLQIVLFGQPELEQTLALPQLRQLKERITHSFTVPRLPPALLGDYLACRLAAAGRATPLVFTPQALRRLARASQGIVRRINILADKALLAAYADDAQHVAARHVRLAIADSPFNTLSRAPWHAGALLARTLIAIMLLLAGALLWQWLAPWISGTSAPATMARPAPQAAVQATASATAAARAGGIQASATAPSSTTTTTPAEASSSQHPRGEARAQASAGTAVSGQRRPASTPLLDSSLAASQAWLARQGPQQLVLHIASLPASDTAAAEAFLQQAQQAIGLRDIHVFRLRASAPAAMPADTHARAGHVNARASAARGMPAGAASQLAIVYGSYPDRASAEAVWTRLATASPQKPLLSNIDSIHKEMISISQEKP